jgi:hypothetical protein
VVARRPCADACIQIPESEKEKASRLVAVKRDALLSLLKAVTSGVDDANDDRIGIKRGKDTVYFFVSLKNLAKQCPRFWEEYFPKIWNTGADMPDYQADQLKEHGIDRIE